MKHLALISILLSLNACHSNLKLGGVGHASHEEGESFHIHVDPADRAAFEAIARKEENQRAQANIDFLKSKGHDIEWFDQTERFQFDQHRTVQVIQFDYSSRVMSWCSGSFVSDKHISTAGHCSPSLVEGASCRGNIVFAYKKDAKSPVTYYTCDRVKVHKFERNQSSRLVSFGRSHQNEDSKSADLRTVYRVELSDYTLYSLNEQNPLIKKESPYASIEKLVSQQVSNMHVNLPLYSNKYFDRIAVGIFVDPPARGEDKYKAKYDVAYGSYRDANTYYEQYIESDSLIPIRIESDDTQPGNSGGPWYLINQSRDFPRAMYWADLKTVRFEDLTFMGALYGSQSYTSGNGTRINADVITNPGITVPYFLHQMK